MGVSRRIPKVGLAAIVWLISALFPLRAVGAEAPAVRGIDVVLLIDSSRSTQITDPGEQRLVAARFLLDYLAATSAVLHVNHRAAFANFGGEVGAIEPLQLVQSEKLRRSLRSEVIPSTDFRPALEFARGELLPEEPGSERKKIVVLFTDGVPDLLPERLTEGNIQRYFKGEPIAGDPVGTSMKEIVKEIQVHGVEILVVAVGAIPAVERGWKELIPESHYISLTSTAQLTSVFHGIFSSRQGFSDLKTRSLQSGDVASVSLGKLVSSVTFSVLKQRPDVEVSLVNDRGQSATLVGGSDEGDYHEIYEATVPLIGNSWTIKAKKGWAKIFIAQRQPHLIVERPYSPQPSGMPLSLRVSMDQPIGDDVRRRIRFVAEITGPGYQSSVRLAPQVDGTFSLSSDRPAEPGEYSIVIDGYLDEMDLEGVQTEVHLAATPVPVIQELVLKGADNSSGRIAVEALVRNSDLLPVGRVPLATIQQGKEEDRHENLTREESPSVAGSSVLGRFSGSLPFEVGPEPATVNVALWGTTTAGLGFSSTISKTVERLPLNADGPPRIPWRAVLGVLFLAVSAVLVRRVVESREPLLAGIEAWDQPLPAGDLVAAGTSVKAALGTTGSPLVAVHLDHPFIRTWLKYAIRVWRRLLHANHFLASEILAAMMKCDVPAVPRAGIDELLGLLDDPDRESDFPDCLELLFDLYRQGATANLSEHLLSFGIEESPAKGGSHHFADETAGTRFLSLHHQCLAWWTGYRQSDGKSDVEGLKLLERVNELAAGLKEATADLLMRRWILADSDPDITIVRNEDSRRLLVLYWFYSAMEALAALDVNRVGDLGGAAKSCLEKGTYKRSATSLRLLKGPNCREALFCVHAVLGLLVSDPRVFLDNLEQNLCEFEKNGLRTWENQFCPEKALLIMILRGWKPRLLEVAAAGGQKAAIPVPITVPAPRDSAESAEVRIALGSEDGTPLAPYLKGRISSPNESLTILDPVVSVDSIAPGVGRVVFRLAGELPDRGSQSVAIRIGIGNWERECEVSFAAVRGTAESYDMAGWLREELEATVDEVVKKKTRAVVVTAEDSAINLCDLRSRAVTQRIDSIIKDVRASWISVQDLELKGFYFDATQFHANVGIVSAVNQDHALALGNFLRTLGQFRVVEVHPVEFFRRRFPGLAVTQQGLTVLASYLPFIREEWLMGRLLTNLGDALPQSSNRALTAEAVQAALNQTPLTEPARERLGTMPPWKIALLGALQRAIVKAGEGERMRPEDNSKLSVDIGMIAREVTSEAEAEGREGMDLAQNLRVLQGEDEFVECDGPFQYRFSNQICRKAVEEHLERQCLKAEELDGGSSGR